MATSAPSPHRFAHHADAVGQLHHPARRARLGTAPPPPTRRGNPPEDFGARSWVEVAANVFRPPRPDLDGVAAKAADVGAELVREEERRLRRKLRATERRRLLQRPEEVQRLWEALALEAWFADDGLVFRGPAIVPTRQHRGFESWERERSYPFRPEDVVALVGDREGVEAVRQLLAEASARLAALGYPRFKSVAWYSVSPSYRFHVAFGRWLVTFLAGCAPPLPEAMEGVEGSARLIELAYDRVEAEANVGYRPLGLFEQPLVEAKEAILMHEWWQMASASGALITANQTHGPVTSPRAVGRPLAEFKSPYEPLVHVLLRGYVVGDIDTAQARVMFPRLRYEDGALR